MTVVQDRDADAPMTAAMIQPLNGRVLIRRALRPEMSAGGIVLPEMTRSISQTGSVVRVAPDACEVVHEGDQVIFSQYASSPCVATLETDLVFVRDRDLLAVVIARVIAR